MKNYEQKTDGETRRSIWSRIGDVAVWLYTGYTRKEVDEGVSWMNAYKYLMVDGEFADPKWVKNREAELFAESGEPFPSQKRKVYTRARLEDYCRHQGVMPDGRVVAQLPTFGTSREELAKVGILADNFKREERPQEDTDQNFVVILPKDWTYGPIPTDPTLQNERWAWIRDGSGEVQAHVLYEHRPYELGPDGFRSFTRIANEQ